ncbi:MAG: prepilin-type N-terminal cleavage/methylation domain-containing protein [Acidaminobacteraceae bacterium]
MNNKKGYTLVEIMIAMAILAIMSAPMLNVFIDSIRVNKMADDQYRSDFIAQKFIEDLRVDDFPIEFDTTVQYEGFSVNVLYKELINNVDTAVTEVKSNFTLPSIDVSVEMYIDSDDKIALRDDSANFKGPSSDPNTYLLKIESTSANVYKTLLSHSDFSDTNTVEVDQTSIIDTKPLTIKIFKSSSITIAELQKINFNILNTTTKNLEVYVINDQLDNINFTVDSSSTSVKLFRNLTDLAHVSTNNFKSYDIEVTVSKNDIEYTKLKTVISK